jgi:tetratricopeptide (TPR) repeat protein
MKKWGALSSLYLFSVVVAPAFAASLTLEGRVRDSRTHMGLPYAKVELLCAGVRIGLNYTDIDGRFRFPNLEPRTCTVSVALAGYNSVSVAVDTSDERYIELELMRPAINAPPQPVSPQVSVQDYLIPRNAQKEFALAQKDIERKDCVRAIDHLENGLRLYDQSASALNDLGNCRRQRGELQRAETAFKRAMALSNAPHIAMNLAETYAAQQRFSEAESMLMEAIRKNAENGDLYYALAVNYFKQERLMDAESAAMAADSRIHRVPDLHLLLAKIYVSTDPDKAVPQLELYLKEAPNGSQSKQVREALKAAKEKKK